MNLNLSCSAVISKKLAKICLDNPLFLYIQPLDNGKMVARLKITCPDDTKIEAVKKIEDLSIMLEINDITEDVKDLGKETPIQNLYTSAAMENSKLAITNPDSKIKTYKNAKRVETQQEQTPIKKGNTNRNFIANYNDLRKILLAVKGVDDKVPQVPTNKKMSRGEAIEFGKLMQSVVRLPLGVYVSNETKGKLCVDDLDLVMNVNEIIELSAMPAQKIKNSHQLKISYEKGLVKFRSKGEYDEWHNRQSDVNEIGNIGLEIFDNHEQAVEQTEEIMVNAEDVPKKHGSKPTVFTEKKNMLKKSDRDLLVKNEDNENESKNIEVTGEEETEEEREIKKLIKDLPEEKAESVVKTTNPEVDQSKPTQEEPEEPTRIPLLSEQAENQEKNKIKRV